MANIFNQRATRNALILILLLASVCLAYLLYHHVDARNKLVVETKQDAQEKAVNAASSIEEEISLLLEADDLAAEFTSHGPFRDYKDVEKRLMEKALEFPKITALTAAFDPNSIPDNVSKECYDGPPTCRQLITQPNSSGDSVSLYSPWTKGGGESTNPVMKWVEEDYDYTDKGLDWETTGKRLAGTAWYTVPMDSNEPTWSIPYFGASGDDYYAGYGVPFYTDESKKTQAGMISADMGLADIQRIVAALTPGSPGDGYGFVIAGNGKFISHPIGDYVKNSENITAMNADWSVAYLDEQLERQNAEVLIFDHEDKISSQESWVFLVPLIEAQWWVGISLDKRQIFKNSGYLEEERKRLALIASLSILVLSLAAALVLRVYAGGTHNKWIFVAFTCAFGISGIIYLWSINLGDDPSEGTGNLELVDPAITAKVVNDAKLALTQSGTNTDNEAADAKSSVGQTGGLLDPELMRIFQEYTRNEYADSDAYPKEENSDGLTEQLAPCDSPSALPGKSVEESPMELWAFPTGVFVQSIDFSNNGRTAIDGYIWRQTDDGYRKSPSFQNYEQSVVLPDGQDTNLNHLYTQKSEKRCVEGLSFSTDIKQKYDYKKYPFQREDIRIRIRSADLTGDNLLTPDLKAYYSTDPEMRPGLSQDIVVNGWDVEKSFFSYRDVGFGTDFGSYDGENADRNTQELIFNISLKRSFLSPLLTNFIPIFVVALLLYGVLLTVSKDPDSKSSFGFSTITVLGFCGTLFFAVIVAHLNMRIGLAAQGVIYIEAFYFALYTALVAVALNALAVSSKQVTSILTLGDNSLIKLTYWPVLVIALYLVTYFTFN
jgi:hypothetical protein